jgi:peptidyl-dipeptidase Dcp
LWRNFQERGIFDAKTAADFRLHILSKGGTENPMDLFVKFRGRKPEVRALLERSGLK